MIELLHKKQPWLVVPGGYEMAVVTRAIRIDDHDSLLGVLPVGPAGLGHEGSCSLLKCQGRAKRLLDHGSNRDPGGYRRATTAQASRSMCKGGPCTLPIDRAQRLDLPTRDIRRLISRLHDS